MISSRRLGAIAFVLFGFLPSLCAGQSFEALLQATEKGDVQTVAGFLDKGLDPSTADLQGNTLLMIAARAGHKDLVTFLIGRKANVTRRSPHGDTALMLASLGGHLEIVKLLVERGATINQDGWAPLHYAAFEGHPAVVKYLIFKGADKNALAPNLYSPLMLATRNGHLEAARALLVEDVDLSVRGSKGETALGVAKERRNEEMETLLRRAGVVE